MWHNLDDDLHPLAVSTSVTRLDMYSCDVHTAFLVALPELRCLNLWNYDVDGEIVEAVNAAFSSLRQLTSLSLWCECTVTPAFLTHLTNLQRLRIYVRHPEEPSEAGDLPPLGAWSSGLHKLGIPWSIAFHSLDTLRHMPALQHLRLSCSPAEYAESCAAWRALLDAAAANRTMLRIDLESTDVAVMATGVCGILLRLKHTHPHLTITCDEGDEF